jgi:hypothetical protein
VNVSVWMLPRPDHDPTLCQMETSRAGGGSDERQLVNPNNARQTARGTLWRRPLGLRSQG